MKENVNVSVYRILLDSGVKIAELAIVGSKGLAYKTLELFKDIYKDSPNTKIIIEKTRCKMHQIDHLDYENNGYKFK